MARTAVSGGKRFADVTGICFPTSAVGVLALPSFPVAVADLGSLNLRDVFPHRLALSARAPLLYVHIVPAYKSIFVLFVCFVFYILCCVT